MKIQQDKLTLNTLMGSIFFQRVKKPNLNVLRAIQQHAHMFIVLLLIVYCEELFPR